MLLFLNPDNSNTVPLPMSGRWEEKKKGFFKEITSLKPSQVRRAAASVIDAAIRA